MVLCFSNFWPSWIEPVEAANIGAYQIDGEQSVWYPPTDPWRSPVLMNVNVPVFWHVKHEKWSERTTKPSLSSSFAWMAYLYSQPGDENSLKGQWRKPNMPKTNRGRNLSITHGWSIAFLFSFKSTFECYHYDQTLRSNLTVLDLLKYTIGWYNPILVVRRRIFGRTNNLWITI